MDVLARYEKLLDDADSFMAACQRPLPSAVRVNTIKTTVERAKRAVDEADISFHPVEWPPGLFRFPDDQPGANWPYIHGWLHGQEEVSAIPPHVLDPTPGDRVWDACAAPGSKTSQLAALMDDSGLLVGTDTNIGRIAALRSNAERLGVTNLAITHEDARSHSLAPFDDIPYDRALVDAPCSCEGTIRKNPDALENWSIEYVRDIANLQTDILARAIQATRPGGTVVYSTCTFAPEENEAVIDRVLKRESCELVDFDIPLRHSPGVTQWEGDRYDPRVSRVKRIYPHQNDTGGFVCAKLEVIGS